MAHFEEQAGQPYDWNEGGVYVIEREDPVDGGLEGVSNRQAAELTRRTRDLHTRQATSEVGTPIAIEAAKQEAQQYADRIVAALVDGSPELLNTLQELAEALGNNPNFATDVLQAIGERVKTADFVAALAGKSDTAHTHSSIPHGALFTYLLNELFGSVSGGRTVSGSLAESDLAVVGKGRVVLSSPNGSWLFEEGQLHRIERVGHTHDSIPNDAAFSRIQNEAFGSVSGGRTVSGALAESDLAVVGKGRVVLSSPNGSWLFEEGQLKRIETAGHTHDSIPNGATFSSIRNEAFGGIASGRYHTGALAVDDMTVEGKNRVVLMAPNGACVYQNGGLHPIYHTGNQPFIRGSVGAAGYRSGGSGFHAQPVTGNCVQIDHNLGTGYILTHTLHQSGEQGLQMEIIQRGNNYISVGVRGLDGSYKKVGFDFMLSTY